MSKSQRRDLARRKGITVLSTIVGDTTTQRLSLNEQKILDILRVKGNYGISSVALRNDLHLTNAELEVILGDMKSKDLITFYRRSLG